MEFKSKPVVLKEQINRPYYIIALGHKESIRKLQTISKDKLNNPEELYMGLHDLGGHKGATSVYGDNGVIENLNSPVTLILDLPNCLHNVDETNAILTNDNNKLNIPVEKRIIDWLRLSLLQHLSDQIATDASKSIYQSKIKYPLNGF